MSVFASFNCQILGDSIVNQVAWSGSEQILALSVYTVDENDREINQVIFTNNEGEVVSKSSILHDYEASAMEWHPTDNIVAIGWGDGMVSCWSVDGKNRPSSLYSNNNQHSAPITVMKWNPLGRRLVTGDKKGTVVVWAVDARGSLNPIRQYKKKGEVTAIIFCLMPVQIDSPTPVTKTKDGKPAQVFSPSFFYGTDRGAVVYADDLGHCTDVQQLSSSIDTMMFFEEKSRLIIITRSLLLTQYHVTDDGRVTRVNQVKLSVPGDVAEKGIRSVVWAGPGLLAAATEEKIVRLFDLAADESYNISLNNALGDVMSRSDRVSIVSFSPVDRYLAVGTAMGLVAIWKFTGPSRNIAASKGVNPTVSTDWELIFNVSLTAPVVQLSWHGGRGIVAAVTEEGVVVLNESVLQSAMCGDVFVLQTSGHEVAVLTGGVSQPVMVNIGMQIRGVAVCKSCFVAWSGKLAKIYRTDTNSQRFDLSEAITVSSTAMAIADSTYIVDDTWFVADSNNVKINNFSGTQKGVISFSETEGLPVHLDINTRYLAIVTNKGCIKVFDIHTPTKAKQLGSSGQFNLTTMDASSTLQIRSIRVNCTGTRVAILTDRVEGSLKVCHADTRIHVYDRSKGVVLAYNFAPLNRSPSSVFWDDGDDRLLSCEAVKNSVVVAADVSAASGNKSMSAKNPTVEVSDLPQNVNNGETEPDIEVEVFIFFATSEHGILMQDSFPRKHPYGPMVGLAVPRLYFRNSIANQNQDDEQTAKYGPNPIKIYSKVMRDFVGIDEVHESTKKALLNFSYNLTLGKLDEAYRAVKAIDSPAIWENMAQMCVKTKRLDVAEVCLGNMGHARGAAALREARKAGNLEYAVGVLAIQLGLLDDAARLFREGNRYDMLNTLYQSAGLWDKAILTATNKDRIHLKTTHYQFAKHLESIGRIDDAIEHYQLSDNSRTEVPRMLFHLGRIDDLGEYVLKSDDAALLKWWAAYLESIERYDKAKKFYSKANDYLSLVRIYCFKGDFNKAAEIVSETGDRASAYHFARQLENQSDFAEAINFYATSGCYNHSIRLAREHGMDAELMRFAMKSTPSLMVECGVHFEERGEFDKAVQLYHKGGDIPRALDLCFRATEGGNSKSSQSGIMFDMLNNIAQDLGDDTSPQTLARCAEFLVQHKQFDKAIDLYVKAGRYRSAIEMCYQSKVTINEEMVDKLSPPETFEKAERKEILLDLAKCLKKQDSYLLAYKKYTQAGDRLQAIKCLVRSGNTKAVIEFAKISKSPEVYKIAANYLQQMNWRENGVIMKSIIQFYTLAKAFIQLAGFYDSCAQVEIDEYSDYEKATSALKEGLKYLHKDTSSQASTMSDAVERRINLIEQFVEAKKSLKQDPSASMAICERLLQDPHLEEAIRAGDCFGMLVDYYYSTGDLKEAYKHMRDMESRNITLQPYLEPSVIEDILRAFPSKKGGIQAMSRQNASEVDDQEDSYDARGSAGNNNNYRNNGGREDAKTQDDDEEEVMDEEIGEEEEDHDSPKKVTTKNTGPIIKDYSRGRK